MRMLMQLNSWHGKETYRKLSNVLEYFFSEWKRRRISISHLIVFNISCYTCHEWVNSFFFSVAVFRLIAAQL